MGQTHGVHVALNDRALQLDGARLRINVLGGVLLVTHWRRRGHFNAHIMPPHYYS